LRFIRTGILGVLQEVQSCHTPALEFHGPPTDDR